MLPLLFSDDCALTPHARADAAERRMHAAWDRLDESGRHVDRVDYAEALRSWFRACDGLPHDDPAPPPPFPVADAVCDLTDGGGL